MRRLRLASGLILLLLLMACGRTAPSPGPVAPPPVPPETADSMAVLPGPGGSAGGPAGPGPGAPAPGSDLKALITPAPAGAFQRLRIAAGKPIDRTGIFFLQTASGEVEGWAVAGDEMDRFWYGTSDDGRWVSAQGSPEYSYVADRKTGAVYRWPWQAALVQGARGEHLLFSVSGRLWLATADMAHFTALGIGAQQPQAFFSPDGTAVAIRADRKLYLVQVGSGEVRAAGELTDPRLQGDGGSLQLQTARGGQELLLVAQFGLYGPGARSTRVQRYAWNGKLLTDQQAPGWGDLSPDGSLVAWEESISGFASTVVLAGAEDLQPRLRVKSADFCSEFGVGGTRWLADSSGVVIRTSQGHRLLRPDGTLADLPAFRGTSAANEPLPAPDRADRFAIEGAVVRDATGKQLAAAVPHSAGKWIGVRGLPWGDRSDEARFYLRVSGKGPRCYGSPLAPQVEMAPFPAAQALAVSLAAGDCLNLRAEADRRAATLVCLPGGTRLVPAVPPGRLNKGTLETWGNPMATSMGGEWWWYARTPDGQRGWVCLSGEYLVWAPSRPGEPAPDPMLGHIGDAVANLRYWLQVAMGERPCQFGCAPDDSFESAVMGATGWCQAGPDRLKAAPTFDPARHGAALVPLSKACTVLQSALATYGDFRDTPAWRQKVGDALSEFAASGG